MAVEARQEGDGEDGRRDEGHRAVEQSGAGEVGEPHRDRAQDGGDDAREHEHPGRVGGERARHRVAGSVPELERDVHEVAVGGRIEEVLGVVVVVEVGDRPRHEVGRLVGVVGVGQPLAHAPQPQAERDEQHEDESDEVGIAQPPGPCARQPARDRQSARRRRPRRSLRPLRPRGGGSSGGVGCRLAVPTRPPGVGRPGVGRRIDRYRVGQALPQRWSHLGQRRFTAPRGATP